MNTNDELNTMRVMVQDGQYDPMESCYSLTVMHSYSGSVGAYQYLLDQDHFCIDPEGFDISNREGFALWQTMKRDPYKSERLVALFQRASLPQDFGREQRLTRAAPLFHHCLSPFSNSSANPEVHDSVSVSWIAGIKSYARKSKRIRVREETRS